MKYYNYLVAHFGLALVVFFIGYYVCKVSPNLFGTLPLLGNNASS